MAGVTGYLTEDRKYHAATAVSFNFQSKKEDSETKVGNDMNLEGGIGGDFLKGGLTVGLDYYASFKLTEDEIEGLPPIFVRGKNRVFAIGPEVTLALARKDTVYGFLTEVLLGDLCAHDDAGRGVFPDGDLPDQATQSAGALGADGHDGSWQPSSGRGRSGSNSYSHGRWPIDRADWDLHSGD